MSYPPKKIAIKYAMDWAVGNDGVSDYVKDSRLRSCICVLVGELKKHEEELKKIKEEVAFVLPTKALNEPIRAGLKELIRLAKTGRWTNASVRRDAIEHTFQADWIKHLVDVIGETNANWYKVCTCSRLSSSYCPKHGDQPVAVTTTVLQDKRLSKKEKMKHGTALTQRAR